MEENKKTNGFAVTSLVLGIIAMLINPFAILGILSIIFSIVGLVKVKTLSSGKGLAIAGLILGIIATIWFAYSFFTTVATLSALL